MGRLVLILIVLAWLWWTIYREIAYHSLRRLVNGLEHPELWLPRRERQAHARKLLRREDDEYTARTVQQTIRQLKEGDQL